MNFLKKPDYKIYVCGMTQNEKKNIDELTAQYAPHVDGHIWVDHGSTDGTKEILEERKGCGKVIGAKYLKYHCHSMNLFMLDGGMKIGDVFILRDSQERFNTEFVKNIREFSNTMRQNGVMTIFSHGKPFMVTYFDDMYFTQSPHYSLQNFRGKVIDLKDYFEKEEEYAYRLWDGQPGGRPKDNAIRHHLKYYLHPISNHCALGVTDHNVYREREANRQTFRLYCYDHYNFDFTIESLLFLLKKEDWKNDSVFVDMMEKEWILKSFYRYEVLRHDFDEIKKTEEVWSLKEYLSSQK